MYLYELLPDGRLAFFKATDGSFAREFALPALLGHDRHGGRSRSLSGDYVAAGTADGRVALQQVHSVPALRGAAPGRPRRRGPRPGTPRARPGEAAGARGLVPGARRAGRRWRRRSRTTRSRSIARTRTTRPRSGTPCARRAASTITALRARPHGHPGGGHGRAATSYLWELGAEPRLASQVSAFRRAGDGAPVLARQQLADRRRRGRRRLAPGSASRLKDDDTDLSLVKAHQYAGQGAGDRRHRPVRARPQLRDRGRATAALVLRHFTSERSVLSFPATGVRPVEALMTPRADGIVVRRGDGTLARYELRNPHPEVSLAGAVRQGLVRGLRPARVRLAVAPAPPTTSSRSSAWCRWCSAPSRARSTRCCSRCRSRSWRRSTPRSSRTPASASASSRWSRSWPRCPAWWSGFIAGLWLASRVETHVVPVLLMVVLLPALRDRGRAALGPPAARPAQAPQARHGAGADRALAAGRRLASP